VTLPGVAKPQAAQTLTDWLRETAAILMRAGVEGGLRDARLLAAAACGLTAGQVLAQPERPLTPLELNTLTAMRRRRVQREPVSRILGRRGFMDLDLEISPATLDPRPDTEALVEAVIAILTVQGRQSDRLDLADLGTGSGAILIALLRALPLARGLGIDIEPAALAVAARNGDASGISDRVTWRQGSWLDGLDATFDLVVSNPPYIPSSEIAGLAPEVVRYDPHTALDGGPDGLDAFRKIIAAADGRIRQGGWLIFEVGAGQDRDVIKIMDPAGGARDRGAISTYSDLGGHIRCVALQHQ
jgi:release factor glutamine methyltransferase